MYLCTLYLAALQGGRRVKGMIPDSRGGADYMSELNLDLASINLLCS